MKYMTVNQLHKQLGRLIGEGKGRVQVCVDKPTFSHNCEGDGCVILNVYGVRFEHVPQIDDDGGGKINKDGSESTRQTVVLWGNGYDPESRRGG